MSTTHHQENSHYDEEDADAEADPPPNATPLWSV